MSLLLSQQLQKYREFLEKRNTPSFVLSFLNEDNVQAVDGMQLRTIENAAKTAAEFECGKSTIHVYVRSNKKDDQSSEKEIECRVGEIKDLIISEVEKQVESCEDECPSFKFEWYGKEIQPNSNNYECAFSVEIEKRTKG